MATTSLTPVIQQIYRDNPPSKPTVQIIEIKSVKSENNEAPSRIKCARSRSPAATSVRAPWRPLVLTSALCTCHRVHISDGEQYGLAVLTAEPARLVHSEAVKANSLIVLKNYVVNQLGSTKCVRGRLRASAQHRHSVGVAPVHLLYSVGAASE